MKLTTLQAFLYAAREGRVTDAQRILQAAEEQNLESTFFYRERALDVAIAFGQVQVVRWLLQRGVATTYGTLCDAYKELAAD